VTTMIVNRRTPLRALFRGLANRRTQYRALLRGLAGLLFVGVLLGAAVSAQAADPQYRNNMRMARRNLMRGQSSEAALLYERILGQHPWDEAASSGYAQALMQMDKLDEADVFLTEALKHVEPKVTLYRKRVDLRRKQDRPGDAFADALEVMALNDGLAPWVFQATRDLLGEGLEPSVASGHAEAALARNPDNPNFSVLTSVILALDDRREEAMALIVAVDTQKKRGGQAVMRYAEELLALGDREEAEAAMIVAADRAGKPGRRSQFLFKLADLVEEDGRYRDALTHLDTIAREREGTSSAGKALIQSAAIYRKHLNDPQGALTVYERLEFDPSLGHYRPEMLLQMGSCYVQLGNFDRADQVFLSVIPEAIDPEHAETAAYRRANVAFYRGDADSALTRYQEMAETYPRSLLTNEAAQRYILLNTYTSLGGGEAMEFFGRMEWGRAVSDSTTVDSTARVLIDRYEKGELAAEAWFALADLAEEAGQHTLAVERLENVVTGHAADRRAPTALRRQGDILQRQLSRTQEALACYESILTEYPDSVEAGEVRRLVVHIRRGLKS